MLLGMVEMYINAKNVNKPLIEFSFNEIKWYSLCSELKIYIMNDAQITT